MHIEEHILSRSGDWVFDQMVAEVFDTHVRKSIPCYEIMQDLIGSLSTEFLGDGALVYDLGTATGEAIRRVHLANPARQISYIGVDVSTPMLRVAEQKCSHIPNAMFCNRNISNMSYKAADFVIAAFTLQFLPGIQRKTVVETVRKSLKSHGALVVCEKIILDHEKFNAFVVRAHERWKEQYFTRRQIRAKQASLERVMKPVTLSENIDMLADAGFAHIAPVFQWGNFVCLLAR